MTLPQLVENTLYFLVLINPPSKILLLSAKEPRYTNKELFSISLRSNIAAGIILAVLACVGNFLLVKIFHVEIYSLSVAGGIILFLIGLTAVREGKFFHEDNTQQQDTDISIVPLAAPLIAGPGIITASISAASNYGVSITLLCLAIALAINFVLMLLSLQIGKFMEKTNASGPMTRIIGLIITAVAAQMIFSGCATWLEYVHIIS